MAASVMSPGLVPKPRYVLLLEPDEVQGKRLGRALRGSGFVPLLAKDASQAFRRMVGALTPVLIYIDLDFHPFNAGDLALRFRGDPRWSSVPIVAATSEPLAAFQRLIIDRVFRRPLDSETLVAFARERLVPL